MEHGIYCNCIWCEIYARIQLALVYVTGIILFGLLGYQAWYVLTAVGNFIQYWHNMKP